MSGKIDGKRVKEMSEKLQKVDFKILKLIIRVLCGSLFVFFPLLYAGPLIVSIMALESGWGKLGAITAAIAVSSISFVGFLVFYKIFGKKRE